MDKAAIQAAAEKLQLLDIVLVKQNLTVAEDRYVLGEVKGGNNISQQDSLEVEYQIVEYDSDAGKVETLIANIGLGSRLVDDEGDEDDAVIATIEAEYHAEYRILNDSPTERELKEFCQFNAVHNVWPFWREKVFTLGRQANLPKFSIPLAKPNKSNKKKKKRLKKTAPNVK